MTTATTDETKHSSKDSIETKTDVGTTIVTITSCEENRCTPVAVTTGVITITENDTVYTTYCPLPTTKGDTSENVAPTTTTGAPGAPKSTIEKEEASRSKGEQGVHEVTAEKTTVTMGAEKTTGTTSAASGEETTVAGGAHEVPEETKTSTVVVASESKGTNTEESATTVATIAPVEVQSEESTEKASSTAAATEEVPVSTYEGKGVRSFAMENIMTIPLLCLALLF